MVTVRSGADRSRYGVLETLRAYGRDRLRENGIDDRYAARHAVYFTELAERAAAGMHSADERAWVERMLPDYDNLRAAFERAMADRDIDLALRLVTSLPELAHLRVGYESAGWAERAVDLADPDHPLFPAAVGLAARGAWNRGEFSRARSLAALAEGRVPGRGTGRVAYPADVLADVALYEGDPHAALAHYEGEVARARLDADPIRLVWALFYVALCHAALRTPDAGVRRRGGGVQVAEATANPTARSMARYALGLVLKKSEPDRALALFDEAADSGRVGAELLVARHRVDGGRGHPCRARRSGHSGADVHRGARPLGPRRGLEPAVAQPAVRDTVVSSALVPTRMPSRCTVRLSTRGSPLR